MPNEVDPMDDPAFWKSLNRAVVKNVMNWEWKPYVPEPRCKVCGDCDPTHHINSEKVCRICYWWKWMIRTRLRIRAMKIGRLLT